MWACLHYYDPPFMHIDNLPNPDQIAPLLAKKVTAVKKTLSNI